MNPLPEEQDNEELKEQEIPAPESTVTDEPDVKIPSHTAPKPKLPFIIGGILTAIAALTVVLIIIFSGSSHEHIFSSWNITKEPTCLATGTEERTCECSVKESRPVGVLSHTEVITPAVNATCTQKGLTEGKHCSVCGTVIVAQTEIPMNTHSFDDEYDSDCNICGYVRDVECAHSETEIVPGCAATCTETGLTDGEKCKKCGEIIVSQSIIPVKAHTEVIDAAVEASCTQTGLTEGKHCSVCGAVIVAQTVIPAKGHTESAWVIDKQATIDEQGLRHKYCTNCGTKLAEEYYSLVASSGLQFALISDGESYYVSGIGSCSDTDVIIPKFYKGLPVTSIGDWAFSDCTSLTSVTIPDSVTNIGNGAFYGCTSLTSVTIPDSVTSIGEYAFRNCTSLTSVTIGDSVTSIGYRAFYGCTSLQYNEYDNALYLGNENNPYHALIKAKSTSVTSCEIHSNTKLIADYAFYNCTSLTSVTIPDSVTSIGNYAFFDCTSLTSVTIPDSVTSIGIYAFYNCTSLTSVTIGDSVTSIGEYAFQNCKSLTSVNFSGTVAQWNAMSKGSYWNKNTGTYTIYCTDGEITKSGWVTYY